MSTVTAPVILDSTGQDISAKLQAIADAINGGTIDPLTVTQNGTYTPSGSTLGYGPVTVDVQGGGSGGEMTLKIADINSTAELLSLASYDFTVNDCAGKYAAILFWARGTITIPTGATIVYSAQRVVSAYSADNNIYLVKVPILSNNETITIGNDSQSRAGGVCFVVSQDFTVTEAAKNNDLSATMTWSAGIYVFAAISISNATSVGVLSQYTAPVSYIFADTTGNTSSATSRMLAGVINAVTANNTATRIGNYGSDSLSGLFVCLKIDPA